MKVKLILFDFDGTIANTTPYNYKKVSEFLKKERKLRITDKEIIENIANNTYFDLLKKWQISFWQIPYILKKYSEGQKELINHIESLRLYPNIKKIVLELKNKGFKIGVLSSNIKENIYKFLKFNNLEVFDYIDCGTHILGKAQALKNFIQKNKFCKDELIYVGDEVRDIKACKKTGIKIVVVDWGLNSKKLLEKFAPDYIISKPGELLKILKLK